MNTNSLVWLIAGILAIIALLVFIISNVDVAVK